MIYPATDQYIQLAYDALNNGNIIVYPTDTLYGLAADPRNTDAVDCIYRLKGRTSVAPLPLIAADIDQVNACVKESSPLACRLAEGFWPGPLTLIYDAGETLAPAMLAGGKTVALRIPAHPVATGIARVFCHPVTATSANRSGGDPFSGCTCHTATVCIMLPPHYFYK